METARPPVTVGQVVRLPTDDVAFGGEGVARLNDFVVFIPFALRGEEVEAEVTEVKRSFARAKLLRVIVASPDRTQPECRYFGECGGCQYQHLRYGAQLELKRNQVIQVLLRVGKFASPPVDPVVPCPSPYQYRNRILVRSQWDKTCQALKVGFLRHDNRLLVDIEECRIADPRLNEQLREVRLHPPPKGGLKVLLKLDPEGWELPPDSFFQTNFALLPELVREVRECVRRGEARHLIDAFCGVGFFSIEVADLVESYLGIELDRRAIRAARANATRRDRGNGEYQAGSVEALLPAALRRFPAAATAVVIDPPRAGCRPETVASLLAARVRQIVYVSCQPATLARDLHALTASGVYQLVRLVPLDMFPQTQHIECVADLRLQA